MNVCARCGGRMEDQGPVLSNTYSAAPPRSTWERCVDCGFIIALTPLATFKLVIS